MSTIAGENSLSAESMRIATLLSTHAATTQQLHGIVCDGLSDCNALRDAGSAYTPRAWYSILLAFVAHFRSHVGYLFTHYQKIDCGARKPLF